MIDWASDEPVVLLNPRFPSAERHRLDRLMSRLPRLERHVWLATSGASGPVKLVALSLEALLASADAVNRHLEATARDVWVNVLPLFHVGGLGILARARLSGSRVVGVHDADGMPGPWSAAAFVEHVKEARGTLSALVPAQVHDLATGALTAPPSLRAVVVGGGALPPSASSRARALGWPLLPSYGCTECASQVATASLDTLVEHAFPPLPVLPHIEADVAEDGFLRFRSPALFTGYARDRGRDAADPVELHDPKQDGWWTAEDRGRRVVGNLYIEGRGHDFVKVGGENVSVSRLEGVLAELRAETAYRGDAALLPRPDERLGHTIALVHAGASKAEAAALVEGFNARVLPFERIRSVHRLAGLPRSPLGKLLREEARRQLEA